MTTPDLINATFSVIAGNMLWINVYALAKDKQVKGVTFQSTVIMTLWGCWNLWYYPHLDQWASFWGGLSIVSANVVWLMLAWEYSRACPNCKGHGRVVTFDEDNGKLVGITSTCQVCLGKIN